MKKRILASILTLVMVISVMFPSTALAETSRVDQIINGMSLKQKVTQMLMVDFRKWGDTNASAKDFEVMNDEVYKIIEEYDFGSIILFANNIKTTDKTFELVTKMQEAATNDGGIAMLISADQEGGSVYRLGSGTALPGNMALGAAGDPYYSYAAGTIIGSELSVLGINTNLAPVVDVNNNANNPVIGLRSYSDDADIVGTLASASIKGMAEYNVIGCAKHFPGHGDTATDSHYGLPSVDKSKEVLMENELKPYKIAIEQGIEMIMTAHILYPQLDNSTIVSNKTGEAEKLPATMSKAILTDLLKGEMGFNGIIVTDAMNMAGIANKWDQVQSVKVAIAAGVDMICMPCQLYCEADMANLDAIINGVVEAVESGEIPEARINDAVKRILTVKENRGILDYKASDYSLEKAKEVVGSDANRELERQIAAAAVTVVKNENNVLPLKVTENTKVLMMVPYNNERGQMIMGWNRAKEAGLIPEGAEVKVVRFNNATLDNYKADMDWADVVIINSEVSSAAKMAGGNWVSGAPEVFTKYCKENGKISIISSVDKPYDVQLYPNADAIVAAYGCKGSSVDPTEAIIGGATGSEAAYGPNIIAAVEVILGTFQAKGTLPVDIPKFDPEAKTYTDEIVYPRGYGLTYDTHVCEIVHVEAVEAGCHSLGNIEYWYCAECETVWADEALTQVTNHKNVIIPAKGGEVVHVEAVEAGCHNLGNVEHWYCEECELVWADKALTQVTNHKNVIIPATGSENVKHVAAVAPTVDKEGNIEYWYCEDCKTYYADEACTIVTNAKNVIVPATEEKVVGSTSNEKYYIDATVLPKESEEYKKAETVLKDVVKDKSYTVLNIDLFAAADDKQVEEVGEYILVTIPVPTDVVVKEGETLVVYRVNDDGTYTKCDTEVKGTELTFKTNHFSTYVVVAEKAAPKTGDATNFVLWFAVLGLGAVAMASGVVMRKRNF